MARIEGTNGDDERNGTASGDTFFMKAGHDKADGRGGADVMHGGPGYDTLNGGEGNDKLLGEADSDVLRGGDGRDTLVGGAGADRLYGGAGEDRFEYNTTALDPGGVMPVDLIHDFTRGDDKIDVSQIDANHNVSGNQAFRFIGEQQFTGAGGEIRISHSGDTTYLWFDVDGDLNNEMQIALAGIHALRGSDFIL